MRCGFVFVAVVQLADRPARRVGVSDRVGTSGATRPAVGVHMPGHVGGSLAVLPARYCRPMDGPPSFVVRHTVTDDGRACLVARTDAPILRGIVWIWTGGRLIDYGLFGHDVVDCLSVDYDWQSAEPVTPFTMSAMSEYLAEYYSDPVNLSGTVQAVVMG